MFADKPTRSNVKDMHNGEFLCNITLNMACLHYIITDIEHSTSDAPGDDVDNDAILPPLIGHIQDDDDANSNDLKTIAFCEDDDDPDVVVPSIMLVIFPLSFCSHYFVTDCISIKDNNDHLRLIHYKSRLGDEDDDDVALEDGGLDVEYSDDNPGIVVFSADVNSHSDFSSFILPPTCNHQWWVALQRKLEHAERHMKLHSMKQVLICSNNKWHHYLNSPKFSMA